MPCIMPLFDAIDVQGGRGLFDFARLDIGVDQKCCLETTFGMPLGADAEQERVIHIHIRVPLSNGIRIPLFRKPGDVVTRVVLGKSIP